MYFYFYFRTLVFRHFEGFWVGFSSYKMIIVCITRYHRISNLGDYISEYEPQHNQRRNGVPKKERVPCSNASPLWA
jgi:hypothetical protein